MIFIPAVDDRRQILLGRQYRGEGRVKQLIDRHKVSFTDRHLVILYPTFALELQVPSPKLEPIVTSIWTASNGFR